jgi:hypothetical protein
MRRCSSIFCLLLAISLTHCAPYRAAWNTGWTEKEANNSIMLIIADPPTLGWRRLQNHATLHPELQVLLTQLGSPDCIAESTQDRRHYLILYYLKNRQAYSCRNDTRSVSKPMEFSGPYPITDKEYRLLSDFQQKALRSLEKR